MKNKVYAELFEVSSLIQKELFAKCDEKNQVKILRIVELLKKFPCKDCDIKKVIEEELGCNWCTTRAIFRRFTGVTISQVHDKIILEHSKKYLQNDHKCIYIAVELGFKDESYFTKWFKKHVGKTPCEYKLQINTNK